MDDSGSVESDQSGSSRAEGVDEECMERSEVGDSWLSRDTRVAQFTEYSISSSVVPRNKGECEDVRGECEGVKGERWSEG